jgi:hypothetical protein
VAVADWQRLPVFSLWERLQPRSVWWWLRVDHQFVIPAKAGIHLDLVIALALAKSTAFDPPAAARVTSLCVAKEK